MTEELELTVQLVTNYLSSLFPSPVIDAFFDNTMVMAEAVKNKLFGPSLGLVAVPKLLQPLITLNAAQVPVDR